MVKRKFQQDIGNVFKVLFVWKTENVAANVALVHLAIILVFITTLECLFIKLCLEKNLLLLFLRSIILRNFMISKIMLNWDSLMQLWKNNVSRMQNYMKFQDNKKKAWCAIGYWRYGTSESVALQLDIRQKMCFLYIWWNHEWTSTTLASPTFQ